MKHLHFLRTAIIAIAVPAVMQGQEFINGSFEQNGGLCLLNTTPNVFNANVKNTHAFGSFRKPDIVSADCGHGAAKDGNWFVGLATNINSGVRSEAITLQLNAPLVEGGQYMLTFCARARSYASNLAIGVSSNDSTIGKIFYTVSAATVLAEWTEITIRFTAPQSGNYVSIQAQNPNSNSGVWLDAFHLKQVFQPDNVVMVSKPAEPARPAAPTARKAEVTIGLFPNPSEGYFKINSDSNTIASLTVYNMLGAQVLQHVATPEQPVPDYIDLTDQQPGFYFVEVSTFNGEKLIKQIIVSR
jgi:hypothetical protein